MQERFSAGMAACKEPRKVRLPPPSAGQPLALDQQPPKPHFAIAAADLAPDERASAQEHVARSIRSALWRRAASGNCCRNSPGARVAKASAGCKQPSQ